MDDLIGMAEDIEKNSAVVQENMVAADSKTNELSVQIKGVIDKLIFSSQVIERLENLVIREKALNPLISDELITMITKAGTDANNAVALTLVALESSYTAQASGADAEATCTLTYL